MSQVDAFPAVRHVRPRTRSLLSVACGVLAAVVQAQEHARSGASDFGQIWFAARALLQHSNPYQLIGPGLPFNWDWPLLFPLPAAIAAIPLAPFSELMASIMFAGLGAGLLAWALMEHGYAPLFGFFSAGVRMAAMEAQWSLLLAATVVVPQVGIFLVAKPTLGAAMFVARPSRWALFGGLALLTLSFLVQPMWLVDWLHAVAQSRAIWHGDPFHTIIAAIPGGALTLLALLRWRRPEARLVAAMACVPLSHDLYDTVPLLLVPRTFGETATLVGLTYVQYAIAGLWLGPASITHVDAYFRVNSLLFVALLYLPCTIMVLRRPNEGTLPSWLEKRLESVPRWLRRRSVTDA